MTDHFCLADPDKYFNASYGVVPKVVRAYHQDLLEQCERNPYKWFTRECKELVRLTKLRLSMDYLNCDPNDIVLVDNSSSGTNSVFESLTKNNSSSSVFESLTKNKRAIIMLRTAYGLIINLIKKYAESSGLDCEVFCVDVDLNRIDKVASDVALLLDTLQAKGYEIVLVCIDHIASAPGILLPVCEIAKECKKRGGVRVFVDGAHALGQVRINLKEFERAGVTYWVTDAHKWFFSPKGSAILWVCKDQQSTVYPVIDCASIGSPGNTVIEEEICSNSLYQSEFSKRFVYLGTKDYTPWIAMNAAMDFIESDIVGGYDELIESNRYNALFAKWYMSDKLDSDMVLSDFFTVSMCNVHLPFIQSNEESKYLMVYLEGLSIYTVVFEYPIHSNSFWIRLCTQRFVTRDNVMSLTNELLIYKNNSLKQIS
jgi:selenocysteine lyase/cysteine desulfurase